MFSFILPRSPCICCETDPFEVWKLPTLSKTTKQKHATSHYLVTHQCLSLKSSTALRAKHAKQEGRCGSLTSSKAQEGLEFKGQSLSLYSNLIECDVFASAVPRGFDFSDPIHLDILLWLPAPPRQPVFFCTSTPNPPSSQAMFNLISHIHLAFLYTLCFCLETVYLFIYFHRVLPLAFLSRLCPWLSC